MKRFVISTLAACSLAGPAAADIDLAAFDACVEARIASDTPAADCVHAAHATCMSFDPEHEAASATLCFVNAKDGWSEGIRTQLAKIADSAEENIAAIAGIEVKYDLLANLLQCDRMNELARLTETPGAIVSLQKARCEATASGLALTKLVLQSRNLP